VAAIDLPGPPGRRFDYLTTDDEGRQLFSAHLAAGLLYVIDLRNNTVIATVHDVPGVEGVAYIGEGHKVYTSNWHENKIGVVDLGQMKVVKKIIWACRAAPQPATTELSRTRVRLLAPSFRFPPGLPN